MKQTVLVFTILLGFVPKIYGQDFYDVNTINTIEITFAESNWDQILDQLYAAGDEDRLVGTVVINGTQYDSVGVRYKGNSTYNANRVKNPFNIKLDHIIDDQELNGYGTLKLSNVYKDPSFVREVLGYEIARNYMPASKANFTKVTVNGTYLGLYSNVQSVDKFFLGNNFNSNQNSFFKGELLNDSPQNPVTVWDYLGADTTDYFEFYELKSDQGWQDLIAFLDAFNNDPSSVETHFNVDRHLWMLAFDILMVNLDAPINFAHNYYLYQDDAGQFNPIIWDLNENFGGFSTLLGQGGGPLTTTGLQQLDPFLNSTNASFPIVNKILSDPTYKRMYVAHAKTILEEVFSNDWYRTRALEIQNIIDAEVQADPNKFYTYDNFISNITTSVGGGPGPGGQSVIGITELMAARVTYLNSQAEFQAATPEVSAVDYSPTNVTPNSEIGFTAEVSAAELVLLYSRNSLSNRFEATEMFDDGNHNDGAAGDGVYGASIFAGADEVQYYIYAENNAAGLFEPKRAANEFYTISVVVGDLVVNEFMADNDTIVADQDGEFDDWIELYNNTGSDISLNGYYLSDDGDELTQWAFPDTFIAANSYLIVWADDDEQDGLHANFKLSASGEVIYLVNADSTIVDEVTFGAQTTDLAYGRFPNGTGDFMEMTPTFASANTNTVTGIEDEVTENITEAFSLAQNYPNPFNPTTQIKFSLSTSSPITLSIYSITGQLIKTLVNEQKSAGTYEVQWDGTNEYSTKVASGIYLYRLEAGNFSQIKKMILLK